MRRALPAVLAVVLGGCGLELGEGSSNAREATAAQGATPQERRARAERAARLPRRDAGELELAGEQEGSLTSNAVKNFAAAQTRVRPRFSAVGATEGFERFCRGEVDIVDSARQISRAELAACTRNGLEIRTPIQIASDAIVLATRNESDVGGDCLTVADVATVYRRGSTVDNWRQLGFDDLPLRAIGPEDDANAFSNFASRVLGVTSGATLADLRTDYTAHESDDDIRRDIVGDDRAGRVDGVVEAELRQTRADLAGRRRAFIGNAVARARDRALRRIRAANRRRARRDEPVRDPAALARRNLNRVNRAKRQAADSAGRRFDRRFDVLRESRTRELTDRARRNGGIGFVRFSFYETYEEQLRPMEIDAGPERDAQIAAADRRARAAGLDPPDRPATVDADGNRRPNCIFPSQQTVTTGEYPLSRRILLYVSTSGLQRSEVRAFLAYTLENAQGLATSTRLVPITDRLRSAQYRFVTGRDIEPEGTLLPGEALPGTSSDASRTSTTTTTTTTPAAADAGPPQSTVPGVSSQGSEPREETP